MEVLEMRVEDLTPYENNPRRNEDAVEKVAASIQEFGFKVPIIIDRDGVIIAGHTRLKAATMLGLKTVPVIRADDLTPDQVKAFRLADNKVGEFSMWDLDALEAELATLEMDMSAFGFLNEDDGINPDDVEEDDLDEADEPGEPKAQRGDIYQLGEHRLMCGDSTDPADVAALMEGGDSKTSPHGSAL